MWSININAFLAQCNGCPFILALLSLTTKTTLSKFKKKTAKSTAQKRVQR